MNESAARLQTFTEQLLAHEGALAEVSAPGVMEVLLPRHVQKLLGLKEIARLSFGAETPAKTVRVGLEGDWLERCAKLLGARGRHTRLTLHTAAPSLADPERALQHALSLDNAIYRFVKTEAAWTRYLLLSLRYTAVSDEKREGLITLCLNLQNGSVTDELVAPLLQALSDDDAMSEDSRPSGGALPEDWPAARMRQMLNHAAPARVRETLARFTTGMERRLKRDLARLHDYYSGLRAEAWQRLQRGRSDTAREQLRLDTAAREYEAKISDVRQKYALSINLEWAQTLDVAVRVQRVQLLIKRRKAERKLALDWNPLARRLDAAPDEWAYTSSGSRVVCDAASHLVSLAGHAACEFCGKEYCRVCHATRCPKCRSEVNG